MSEEEEFKAFEIDPNSKDPVAEFNEKLRRMKEAEPLKEPTWKELKDIFLSKKQGEALERGSTPLSYDEAISLGHFGHQAVYAIGIIEAHQSFIFSLTGYRGSILTRFNETVGRASGSIQAKRMDETFVAVGQLGQYQPFPKSEIPTPEMLGAPDD